MYGPNRRFRLARRGLLVLVALAALLAAAPSAHAVATITNSSGTNWLESLSAPGEGGTGMRIRVTTVVKHDPGREVTGLRIDDDYDGTDETGSVSVRAVTSEQPSGTFNYSRVTYEFTPPEDNIDFRCVSFSGPLRRVDKPIRLRARLDDGQQTQSVASNVHFVANGQCGGATDYPFIFNQSQSATRIDTGQSINFTFTGDDADITGTGNQFGGVNVRLRRLSDGAIVNRGVTCFGNSDNTARTITIPFANRGRWVVEAELRNADNNCSENPNSGRYFRIGSVDVNSSQSESPHLSFSGVPSRVHTGQSSFNVTANVDDSADAAQGGDPQMLEWDADRNNTNGPLNDGYERRELGDNEAATPLTPTHRTQTVNTSGLAPGTYTLRARVTDNGAINGADTIRRVTSQAATYQLNAPPTANPQSGLLAESGKPLGITLTGSDPDNDSLTYSIVSGPSHGTLTGSGANRTYTPASNYAGPDSFTFRVDDGFGGQATATVSISVRPDTKIDSGPSASGNNPPDVSFSFSSEVPDVDFECRLDSNAPADWQPCTSPKAFQNLSDGQHTFEVRSRTASGLIDPTPATRTFTVDAIKPQTTLGDKPPALSNNPDVSFTYSSSESGSTFRCKLDSEPEGDCPASGKSYTDLEDGEHTFTVYAIDPVGNADDTPETYTFTIDTAAPQTTIDVAPPAETGSSTANFEFSSSEENSTFECELTGPGQSPGFGSCTSPFSRSNLADGEYTFSVQARDQAGNTDGSPDTHTFRVDTTGPVSTITERPPATTNERDARFEFTGDDPDVDEAGMFFECRVDGEDFRRCASPETLADLPDGEYTFEVRAVDRVGNPGAAASWTFTVDATESGTLITSGPNGPINTNSASFGFEAEDTTIDEFECQLDGGLWEDCDPPKEYSLLSEGRHTFRVRSIDAAGNRDSTPAARSFRVDLTDPDTTIEEQPRSLTNSNDPVFVSSSNEAGSSFECKLDGGNFGPCDARKEYENLDDGEHTFQVRSTDRAGNLDTSPDSYTWTIDTAAPAASITDGPAARSTDTSPTFEFDSSEPTNATFRCRMDSGEWRPCDSPEGYSGLDDGDHTFAVRAIDAAGNEETGGDTHAFTVDTGAPQTAIEVGPSGLRNSRKARFRFGSSEAGSTFECELDGGGFDDCGSPQDYDNLVDGQHTFRVRATDDLGNQDASPAERTWQVDATPPDTRIDSGPSGTTTSDDATYRFRALGGGVGFECRLDGGAWRDCSSPHTYRDLAPGDHSFAVRSIDAAGNVDPSPSGRNFRVVRPPTPPSAGDAPQEPGGVLGEQVSSPRVSCSVVVLRGGCGRPSLSVRARRNRGSYNGTDLTLSARSGGAHLRRAAFKLSSSTMVVFAPTTRGRVIGIVRVLTRSGRTLRRAALRLPPSVARSGRSESRVASASRTSRVYSSRGMRVSLREGFGAPVTVSGLPRGAARVVVSLRGRATCVLRALARCQAERASARLTDRGGGSRRLRGRASGLCRRLAGRARASAARYVPRRSRR